MKFRRFANNNVLVVLVVVFESNVRATFRLTQVFLALFCLVAVVEEVLNLLAESVRLRRLGSSSGSSRSRAAAESLAFS